VAENGPRIVAAGEREADVLCSACGAEIRLGERTALCRACGAVHHERCWLRHGGCCGYECSAGSARPAAADSLLKISRDELASAVPLPSRPSGQQLDAARFDDEPPRWNRTAVWAFAIALAGIPLFGLITGLIATIFGCVALVVHAAPRRGMGLAIAAIVIGLADVFGWSAALFYFFGETHSAVALQEFVAPDPASLKELPEPIQRAMWANVLVESSGGFARQGIGSGVILRIKDQLAWIVTNRHVVDHKYSSRTETVPDDLGSLSTVTIRTAGQLAVPAKIEWVAPRGIDLTLLSAVLDSRDIREARWDLDVQPRVGDEVFAVGNPHGLGWTHSTGKLSQVRRQTRGELVIRLLQSSTPLNPGNSGGGLYDQQGRLLGINTLAGDDRFVGGLGFSISLPTLIELLPEKFRLARKNPSEANP